MTLSEFFKENDVRIGKGKDFTVSPPVYYSSLQNGFYFYFQTYADRKLKYQLLLDVGRWTRNAVAFELTGADDNIVFSILGFHRFFELLIKDVLRRIDPFLAVRLPEREKEIFMFHERTLSPEELRTVEYSDTIKRFKHAFKHYDKESEVYQGILLKYEFIIEESNQAMLDVLHSWRNRIMHNGNSLPNLFAYEFLITQGLVPMIIKVLEAEKEILNGYYPGYFITPSKINLLTQLSEIKFSFTDFENEKRMLTVGLELIKIGHLKEMGRASYTSEIESFRSFSHSEYAQRARRLAQSESTEADHVNNLTTCPCCNLDCLVVYSKTTDSIWREPQIEQKWCLCLSCSYSIRDDIGDPFQFEIVPYPVFGKTDNK